MPSNDYVVEILRPVVAEFFPHELEAFNVSGAQLLALARGGASQAELRKSVGLPSELGPAVYESLQYIALIWGAVKAIKEAAELVGLSGTKKKQAIENLALEMELAGMDGNIAHAIATRFGPDVLNAR